MEEISFQIDNSYIKKNDIFSNNQDDLEIAKNHAIKKHKEVISDKDKIKLLSICDNDKEIEIANSIAEEIKNNYKHLIIFGIGGSSLGGKTLCESKFYQLLNINNEQTKITFIENIHYYNFNIFLRNLDFNNTAFLTISKSGITTETISQILVTLNFFNEKIKRFGADNFYFLTEDKDNPLHNIAKSLNRKIIVHHNKIGGRFSCFTPVSMIPAAIAGFDLHEFVKGGKKISQYFLDNNKDSIFTEGAGILHFVLKQGYQNHVFMPYMQRLYNLIYWYSQLFAESLGKDGKGMTPIKAIGSIDQHSQLQLFIDGPKDKFFTFINQSTKGLGDKIIFDSKITDQIDYLRNNSLGDVIDANQKSTIDVLAENNCPIRNIIFKSYNDKSLGELMMYLMLETILLGYCMDVNPFNQPAVEIGKNKAKNILKKNINNQ